MSLCFQFGDQLTPEHRNRSHFFKLGIGAVDEPYTKPPYYTIKTLMTRNNHSYIDILKIDVEGAEFDSLEKLFYDFEGLDLPVGQLMVELHLVNDLVINFKRLTEWWARLESFGMRGTYLEVNLLAVVLNNDLPGQGRQPRCVEVSSRPPPRHRNPAPRCSLPAFIRTMADHL